MLKFKAYPINNIEQSPAIWDAYVARHVKFYVRLGDCLTFQHSHMFAPYLAFISKHLLKDGLYPTKERWK